MKLLITIFVILSFYSCNQDGEATSISEIVNNPSLPEEIQDSLDDITEIENIIPDNYQEFSCQSLNGEKKGCLVSDDKNLRIIDFIIRQDSSAECLEKKGYRARPGTRKIVVAPDCDLKGYIKVAPIQKEEFILNSENENISGLGMGAISLPKKLKAGNVVEFNESDEDVSISYTKDGIGINGGNVVPSQLNYDPVTKEFEALMFAVPENSIRYEITVSRMFAKESTGERGMVILLNEDNEIVGKRHLKWKKDTTENVHTKTVKGYTHGATKMLVVPRDYRKDDRERTDSSDFYVKALNYTTAVQ